MKVRYLNIEDINSISKLYKLAFDKSYLSVHYSIEHLNKYFESLINYNKYCYVAEDENRIIGFLIGGFKTQEAVNIFLKEYKKEVLFYAIRNPKFLLIRFNKILKNLFKKNPASKASLRLFIIAVDPMLNNIGIGKQLIHKFEEDIKKDGYYYYGLYVRANNINALKFYDKRGFVKEFKNHNQYSYIKNLSN